MSTSDRSDRSRSTLDHQDPKLPLWDVVQDLYATDLAQENTPQIMQNMRPPPGNMELDPTE